MVLYSISINKTHQLIFFSGQEGINVGHQHTGDLNQ